MKKSCNLYLIRLIFSRENNFPAIIIYLKVKTKASSYRRIVWRNFENLPHLNDCTWIFTWARLFIFLDSAEPLKLAGIVINGFLGHYHWSARQTEAYPASLPILTHVTILMVYNKEKTPDNIYRVKIKKKRTKRSLPLTFVCRSNSIS